MIRALTAGLLAASLLALAASADDEDPICGDQYDDMVCVLEPGHDGHHYDDDAITEWADVEAGEGQ